jgi:hypothetical protein
MRSWTIGWYRLSWGVGVRIWPVAGEDPGPLLSWTGQLFRSETRALVLLLSYWSKKRVRHYLPNPLFLLVGAVGFEPTTR